MTPLEGNTAVVTGGRSGIGRGIARGFAEHGADAVVVADVQENPKEGGRPTHELLEAETDTSSVFVECDEHFVIRPGDRIPLDGIVTSGQRTVDQSSLTGESVPVSTEPGDEVFGGTINDQGGLEVRVTHRAAESATARHIHMVEAAQSERAPTQRLIDRLEQPSVLGVLAMTALAVIVPPAFSGSCYCDRLFAYSACRERIDR